MVIGIIHLVLNGLAVSGILQWDEWGAWMQCPVSCGQATQLRFRLCAVLPLVDTINIQNYRGCSSFLPLYESNISLGEERTEIASFCMDLIFRLHTRFEQNNLVKTVLSQCYPLPKYVVVRRCLSCLESPRDPVLQPTPSRGGRAA